MSPKIITVSRPLLCSHVYTSAMVYTAKCSVYVISRLYLLAMLLIHDTPTMLTFFQYLVGSLVLAQSIIWHPVYPTCFAKPSSLIGHPSLCLNATSSETLSLTSSQQERVKSHSFVFLCFTLSVILLLLQWSGIQLRWLKCT